MRAARQKVAQTVADLDRVRVEHGLAAVREVKIANERSIAFEPQLAERHLVTACNVGDRSDARSPKRCAEQQDDRQHQGGCERDSDAGSASLQRVCFPPDA